MPFKSSTCSPIPHDFLEYSDGVSFQNFQVGGKPFRRKVEWHWMTMKTIRKNITKKPLKRFSEKPSGNYSVETGARREKIMSLVKEKKNRKNNERKICILLFKLNCVYMHSFYFFLQNKKNFRYSEEPHDAAVKKSYKYIIVCIKRIRWSFVC